MGCAVFLSGIVSLREAQEKERRGIRVENHLQRDQQAVYWQIRAVAFFGLLAFSSSKCALFLFPPP